MTRKEKKQRKKEKKKRKKTCHLGKIGLILVSLLLYSLCYSLLLYAPYGVASSPSFIAVYVYVNYNVAIHNAIIIIIIIECKS
jgi:hypothetical protein